MSDRIEIWICDACGAASVQGFCPKCGLPRAGEATEILAEFFDLPRASSADTTQTHHSPPAPEITGPATGSSPVPPPLASSSPRGPHQEGA